MEFRDATEAAGKGISHDDLATRLGVHVQRVRQARLDPSADGYRPPPPGWQAALAALAHERGAELLDLAAALADHIEGS